MISTWTSVAVSPSAGFGGRPLVITGVGFLRAFLTSRLGNSAAWWKLCTFFQIILFSVLFSCVCYVYDASYNRRKVTVGLFLLPSSYVCDSVTFLCSAWLSVVKRAGCMAPLILFLSVLTAAVLIIYFEHVPTTCLHGGLYFVQFNVWLFDACDLFVCTVTSVL